jgi:drug/metabolite transporter (DMT)-like permease
VNGRTLDFFPQESGLCLRNLCCLLWGSSYPAIKSGYELFQIATDDVPSKIVFAGYRFLFAGALLLLFALAQRKPIARLNPVSAATGDTGLRKPHPVFSSTLA